MKDDEITRDEQLTSSDEFKAIFDNVRDGIVLLTLTGRVLKVNQRIIEVGGYSEDEIVGRRFTQLKLFPLKSRVQMAARFSKELMGVKTPPLEVEAYSKAGEKIDVEIHGSIFKIKGKGKVSVAILRDISERKKLEEKLKKYSTSLEQEVKERTDELSIANKKLHQQISEHKRVAEDLKNSEEQQKTLFEFAPDGYYISDLKGNFVDGNKAAEEITGYKRKDNGVGYSPRYYCAEKARK